MPNHTIEPLLLSTGRAAKFLGVGRNKILQLVRNKKLPCKMMGGRIRIAAADLRAFADSLPGYTPGRAVRLGRSPVQFDS